MAYITAMVGAAEFALNPVAGHLSDMIGEVLIADARRLRAVWPCSSVAMQQCGHAAV
jgi:hypothetical protein